MKKHIAMNYHGPEKEDCDICHIDYNSEIINPYVSAGSNANPIKKACPICALYHRNRQHGMPLNTPFTGTMAGEYYDRAVQSIKDRGLDHPLLKYVEVER